MINVYIMRLNVKDTSKERKFYGIKNFFDFLVKSKYLTYNPCVDVTPPRDNEEHQITSLTKDEIKQSVKTSSENLYHTAVHSFVHSNNYIILFIYVILNKDSNVILKF